MAGCGVQCMKYLLFVFNFIIWLGGAGILALGLILHFGVESWISIDDITTLLDHDDELLQYGSYVLIGAGALVFVVAFCGCYGAISECRYMLVFYLLFLLIVFCAQIAAAVLASIYSMEIEDEIDENLRKTFDKAYGNDAKDITSAWQLAEASLECCGYDGGSDYRTSQYKNSTDRFDDFPNFPVTCCVGASYDEYKDVEADDCKESWDSTDINKDTKTYHGEGCKKKVEDLIDQYIHFIRSAGIGLALIQLVCIIFSICLCRNIEKD